MIRPVRPQRGPLAATLAHADSILSALIAPGALHTGNLRQLWPDDLLDGPRGRDHPSQSAGIKLARRLRQFNLDRALVILLLAFRQVQAHAYRSRIRAGVSANAEVGPSGREKSDDMRPTRV